MNARKPRKKLPRCFIWSAREHKRFTLSVEQLVHNVRDLTEVTRDLQRQLAQLRDQVALNGQASAAKGGVQ